MPFWLKARSFPLGLPRTTSLGRWPLDGRAMATIPPAELHKKNAKGVLLSRDAVTKLLTEKGMLQENASALLDALAAHCGVKKQERKQAMMVDMGKFRNFVYGGSPEKKLEKREEKRQAKCERKKAERETKKATVVAKQEATRAERAAARARRAEEGALDEQWLAENAVPSLDELAAAAS